MKSAPASNDALCERFKNVQKRIDSTLRKCGRTAEGVTLVAISKTHPAELIQAALQCGLSDVGENRIQEAEPKIEKIGRSATRWHLVGHLQANKARKAIKLFDVIHSLDSLDLARRLNRQCDEEGRDALTVLLQVKLSAEQTKSGVAEEDLFELAREVSSCDRLRLVGLMTVPPYFDDPEKVRPFFKRLRELRDELGNQGSFAGAVGELSMGMTHDFEVAIEEGATMLRIGTAIFGERAQTA